MGSKLNVVLLFFAVLLSPALWLRYKSLPVYEKTEPWFHLTNLWTETELDNLRELVRSQKILKTAAEDFTNAVVLIDEPLNHEGVCPHRYLVERNGRCVFPSRVDMASHYMKTGGRYGAKEKFTQMVNNIQSFQNHIFGDDLKRPELKSLFESKDYLHAAKTVCGPNHPVIDRVQVNVVMMLPGQDLPMHYDLPWFKNGANRFNLPQWLLLAMAGSGLWADEAMPQVQGVAYLHLNETINGGSFFLYPDGPGGPVTSFPSNANTGSVLDGIKVIHGVNRFMPGRVAPNIGKRVAKLMLDEGSQDSWTLVNEDQEVLGQYNMNELRITLVWRSLCFESEEQRSKWNPKSTTFNAEDALQALEKDLRKRGVLGEDQPRPEMLEFALMLIDEYIKYPIDNFENAWFPLNYCALPNATTNKFLKQIFETLVNVIC